MSCVTWLPKSTMRTRICSGSRGGGPSCAGLRGAGAGVRSAVSFIMAGGYSSVFESAMTSNWLMQSLDQHRGARMAGAEQDDFEAWIRRSIDAYHESALIYAAVKLGLPETMGTRSWTVEGLATELGLPQPHLARFMRGLSSLGVC